MTFRKDEWSGEHIASRSARQLIGLYALVIAFDYGFSLLPTPFEVEADAYFWASLVIDAALVLFVARGSRFAWLLGLVRASSTPLILLDADGLVWAWYTLLSAAEIAILLSPPVRRYVWRKRG